MKTHADTAPLKPGDFVKINSSYNSYLIDRHGLGLVIEAGDEHFGGDLLVSVMWSGPAPDDRIEMHMGSSWFERVT